MIDVNLFETLGKIEFRLQILQGELEALSREKEAILNEIYTKNENSNNTDIINTPTSDTRSIITEDQPVKV